MSPIIFMYFGAAMALIGIVVSDFVMSRALFAFAAALLVYGLAASQGSFILLVWTLAALLLALMGIWRHIAQRHTTPLTDEEAALARELTEFAPADFRRLMKITTWQTLDGAKQLTEQGEKTDKLYYIVSGGATVNKSNREIEVGEHVLIGEISFTQNVWTTATVTAHAGSVLVSWPVKKLRRLLKRKSLKAAFDALLAHDLADKLAADEVRRATTETD